MEQMRSEMAFRRAHAAAHQARLTSILLGRQDDGLARRIEEKEQVLGAVLADVAAKEQELLDLRAEVGRYLSIWNNATGKS
jgi:hypothetical protein